MATNYAERLTLTHRPVDRDERGGDGFITRAFARLGQAICFLHGHDSVLHFEENRVMLRCTSCGYDSPGWDVGHRRPRLRYEGDARRHAVEEPRRLTLRRTA